MLNHLIVHCGGRHASREKIEQAPIPQRTKSWVPIPHHRLLNQVEATLEGQGFRIVSEAHALWGEQGERYFGLLELQNGKTHDDYTLVVGLRNSHDKKFPASLSCGNQVFVCDNLSFSGEVSLSRRHTRFIERDLPQIVNRAVGKLTDLRGLQDLRIGAYQARKIQDRSAHDLIVRAVDSRVIPVTQLPRVVKEWREPSHPEFTENGKTVWRLFNAFTEVLKGRCLELLPGRTQALHGLLDSTCGLTQLRAAL